MEDGGGGDVDALGDHGVFVPEQLHAQKPPGVEVAGDPNRDAVGAGVAGVVVIVLGRDGDRGEPGRGRFVIAHPGPGGGLIEDAHHLGARAAREQPVPASAGPAGGGARAKDHASGLQVGDAAARQLRR